MVRIRNRIDLFNLVEDNPPTPAIGEALSTGGAELLGGFSPLSPSKSPGWIIIVTSKRRTVWNVALTLRDYDRYVTTWIIERIPWEHWVGKIDRGRPSTYDGDHPRKYEEKRRKTRTTLGYPNRD